MFTMFWDLYRLLFGGNPIIGERYRNSDKVGNPFEEGDYYEVLDVKNGWVKYKIFFQALANMPVEKSMRVGMFNFMFARIPTEERVAKTLMSK